MAESHNCVSDISYLLSDNISQYCLPCQYSLGLTCLHESSQSNLSIKHMHFPSNWCDRGGASRMRAAQVTLFHIQFSRPRVPVDRSSASCSLCRTVPCETLRTSVWGRLREPLLMLLSRRGREQLNLSQLIPPPAASASQSSVALFPRTAPELHAGTHLSTSNESLSD